jgi:Secretion system C-terminal sorting domain
MINVPTANPKTVVLDSSNLTAAVDLTVNATGTVTTGMTDNGGSHIMGLVLYPNPTTDYITVNSYDNVVVSIYSITGSLVAKESINQFQQLSVGHLPVGIYVVTMVKGGDTITQKMIKQ